MIKAIVKRLIPFYSSYIKSASSSIHNQSYFNYVKFRITGICNRGGTIQYIRHVPLQIQEKYMWGVMQA